ncbi:MAG: DUF2934 domain-containing protein [Nitrospirae bacterium]|jgi:hypothetical protein|nr:DUF2934 domain-containing protein [Nitrospirota bacterium]
MKWYDEIAKIARELYEKSGKREGCDLDNWLEAERIVMERHREEEKLEAESSSSPEKTNASTTKQIIKKTETKTRRTKK